MSTEAVALAEDTATYRLPRTALPVRYDIHLTPNLADATFRGMVTITLDVSVPVKEIALNALELEIKSVNLKSSDLQADAGSAGSGKREGTAAGAGKSAGAGSAESGKREGTAAGAGKNAGGSAGTNAGACAAPARTPQVILDREHERAVFRFKDEIAPGRYALAVEFEGVLNDKLHGFYRSAYKDEKGKEKRLAVTQFEPTDARRAFPCFDEPDFKATYKITLVVDKGLTAISNSPVEKTTEKNGKTEFVFKETMKMSTYIVAFVVGELEGSKPVDVDGTPVRVFTPRGKVHLGKYATEAAAHSLKFFNDYYGISYPGEKLDLIAVPDFMFGAMENLGAVIFRENALLVDEKTASLAELERIGDIVAHELAHMWFGDLATMKWWNGLWLNEAFATFMSMLAVDDWKPEWHRWDTFGASRAQAFATDGLMSTRPIEFSVRNPEEAEGMFDVLTYEKGASVLRMLERYLGADVFRKGISHYLNRHKYANAETTDLWDALEESSGQPVRQLMDSWIFQEGHPVIFADKESDSRIWSLTQQRFFLLPEEKRSHVRVPKTALYQVPVLYRYKAKGTTTAKTTEDSFLLAQPKRLLELDDSAEWLLVNSGGHGFYRTQYSERALDALTASMFDELTAIERFNLIQDAWAATLNGSMSFNDFAAFAARYKDETDKNVWTALIGILTQLDRIIGKGNRMPFREFAGNLLNPTFRRLGFSKGKGKKEDLLTGQLRGMIIQAMGNYAEDASVRAGAAELYSKAEEGGEVSPDVVPALIQIMAAAGDRERYDRFVKHFSNAGTPQEEERYMYGLAAFREKDLLKKTLDKTLNGDIRTQSAPYIVRQVMWNPYGRELAWTFMKSNFDKMLSLYPDGMIARMCEGVTGLISDELLIDAQEFFLDHEVKQGKKLIAQHLEKLAVAVHFKERERLALDRTWVKAAARG